MSHCFTECIQGTDTVIVKNRNGTTLLTETILMQPIGCAESEDKYPSSLSAIVVNTTLNEHSKGRASNQDWSQPTELHERYSQVMLASCNLVADQLTNFSF